jgi:hypothetical protein
MDNHADNFIISDNYMAGLIDSDFSVCINRQVKSKGKTYLTPVIQFENTNFNLINVVSEYLHNMEINHYVGNRKATVYRDTKYIQIRRYLKCSEFSNKLQGFCVVRAPQLKILNMFCVDRLLYVNNKGCKINNTPYTELQLQLYNDIVRLNSDYNHDNDCRNYTINWLAGMIDGDGSLYFSVLKKNLKIIPSFEIQTWSLTACNNISYILDKYHMKYYLGKNIVKASKTLGKRKRKPCYIFRITSYEALFSFLKLLDGKLVAKQRQLKLMLKYMVLKKVKNPNTEEIWNIVKSVKFLNHNPNYKDISETNTQDTEK